MQQITFHPTETFALAKKLVQDILKQKNKKHATVIALYGNLGGGKTTFTQGIAKVLGIQETVPSPTFIIERIYALKKKSFRRLIHIDAYRLENKKQLRALLFNALLKDPQNLIVVEWADKIESAIPKDAFKIYFKIHNTHEHARHIDVVYPHEQRKT